ncbi:MAG: HEAT repeat domain-containing protein, partial [Planctomycetota bacterium]
MRTAILIGLAVLAQGFLDPLHAQDPRFSAKRIWETEQRLVAELSLLRQERGLPPLVWCERMAMPLRVHMDLLLEVGYRGEGSPTFRFGNVFQRATKYHAWPWPEIFANFGTARGGDYDPREQIDRMLTNTQIQSYTNGAQNAGACVMRRIEKGKVLIYLAVGKIDKKTAREEREKTGALAAWIIAGKSEEKEAALSRLWPERTHEGVPFYLSLLQGKESADKVAALRALGGVGDPSLIPLFVETLGDPAPRAREAAHTALKTLAGRDEGGKDAQGWRTWWIAHRADFKPAGPWLPPPPPKPEAGAEPETKGDEENPPPPPSPPEDPLAWTEKAGARHLPKLLAAKEPKVAVFGVWAVRPLGDPKIAGRLPGLLNHASFPVREAAARTLVHCAHKSLYKKIVPALRKA